MGTCRKEEEAKQKAFDQALARATATTAAEELTEAKKGSTRDPAKVAFRTLPGRVWSPLQDYPRNATCFCQRGQALRIKFKNCCVSTIPRTIDEKDAPKMRELVRQAKEEHECKKRNSKSS